MLLELVKKQVHVKTIRALRVLIWAHVMSTLGVQQPLKQEPNAFMGLLGITITRELGATYDISKNQVDSIPGELLDCHRMVGSWMGASEETTKFVGGITEHTNNHDGVGFAACFEGLRQELATCKRKELPNVPCYDQPSRRLQ